MDSPNELVNMSTPIYYNILQEYPKTIWLYTNIKGYDLKALRFFRIFSNKILEYQLLRAWTDEIKLADTAR